MAAIAVSLGVMSYLHLGGSLALRSTAGIPEAIIGVVLLAAAAVVLLAPARARTTATAATVFAIAGFVLGLTFTVTGGNATDIAYHATVLPILVLTLVLIRRSGELGRVGRTPVASRQ